MVKQTAGRDALNDFAPKFAELNDDVLFGEVWSREGQLPLKLRSIVTITALISKGITDSSLTYHLTTAKQNGVTKTEMAELLTHLAFYAGWPNAWAAFRQAKEVYADDGTDANGGLFGLGKPNTAYAQYFTGESFLNPLTDPAKTVFLANVTFSPRLPQQLAHPPCKVRRRSAAFVYRWARLVSGGRQARTGPAPRRRGDHPGRGQALARRAEGLLVQPHRRRVPRRGDEQRVAGARHGRGIRSARRRLCTKPVNLGFPAHIFCIPPLVLPPTTVV